MSSIYQKKKERLQSEIKSLQRQDGSYNPEDLIAWAKANRTSELYKSFDWNDKSAGHQYRLVQARGLLERHLVVEVKKRSPKESQLISITSRRGTEDGSYLPVHVVSMDKTLREEALQQAVQQLIAIRRRYGWLKELSAVWETIPD